MKRAANRLSVLFLMLLGALPQLLLAAESLELIARTRLWLWIVGLAICLWLCACFRHGLLLGMPAAAALLYAAYQVFDARPLNELDDFVDRFSGAYYQQFYAGQGSYKFLDAAQDHSFLLLLLAFLLLAYLSSALTSRGGRRFMCLLGSVPLPAACLAVNGLPSYAPIVALLLFWALVLLSGNYEDEGPSGKLVFVYALPVLILLSALLILSHPEDYEFDEQDWALSQQFDRIGEWIRQWINRNGSEGPLLLPDTVWTTPEQNDTEEESEEKLLWESGEGGMDLTQQYDPSLLEQLYFRVTAQTGGTIYLRALSYGDYLGDGWASAGDAPLSSLTFAANSVQGETRALSLLAVTKLRYAALPYYSTVSAESDSSVPAALQSRRESYLVGELNARESEDELLYRSYAYETYTRLPDSTRAALQSVITDAGLSTAEDPIAAVAAYVRDAGEYDTETEPYPSSDYAVYFLTTARRGYCVHFATAATALYRALGIPARITEGFLVSAESGRSVDVKGEDAHAWVEVYRDGVGWVPVEVTGRGGLHQLPDEPEETEPPEDAPRVGEATPEPIYVQQENAVTPLPVGVVQQQENSSQTSSVGASVGRVLLWLLVLAILAAALPVWRRLIRKLWDARVHAQDTNRAAVALYKRAQQLQRFGGAMPRSVQNCAEKAFFSARGVTEEELSACMAQLDAEIEKQYAALSPIKRFSFRFIYGFK